jgi:hypothetical protein
MSRVIAAFLGGIGAALLVGVLFGRRGRHTTQAALNLNQCTADELLGISALDADLVDRILENRPYRNPLDLVSRMVIPSRVYGEIKNRVHVPREAAAAEIQVG